MREDMCLRMYGLLLESNKEIQVGGTLLLAHPVQTHMHGVQEYSPILSGCAATGFF